MTDIAPAPAPANNSNPGPTLGQVVSAVTSLLSNRNLHKLAGTALGILGLTSVTTASGKFEAVVGAAYAALMHITGGLKKVAD